MNTSDYQAKVDATFATIERLHRDYPGATVDLLHRQAEGWFDVLAHFVHGLVKPGVNPLDGTPKK